MSLHTKTVGSTVTAPAIAGSDDLNTGIHFPAADQVALVAGGTTQVRVGASYPGLRCAKVALAALDAAGGVLAWVNPEGASILVTRVVFDVTTKSTGACTIDVGVAADGTTSNDTIMDGLDIGTAAGTFDNIENQGTNGVSAKKMTSTQYITASKASGAAAGTVGYAYIYYNLV